MQIAPTFQCLSGGQTEGKAPALHSRLLGSACGQSLFIREVSVLESVLIF